MNFHDVRFPTDISRGAQGGPERRTEIVTLGSGHEERNSRWADSRRSYNAGYGVKSLDDLHAVIAFFEERRGRLFGFRWKDHLDFKSGAPQAAVTASDMGAKNAARLEPARARVSLARSLRPMIHSERRVLAAMAAMASSWPTASQVSIIAHSCMPAWASASSAL